jgi:hypothetical protein
MTVNSEQTGKIVRPCLSQNELCELDRLMAKELNWMRGNKKTPHYKFLRHLRRKLKRNIRVNSSTFDYKKRVEFVNA